MTAEKRLNNIRRRQQRSETFDVLSIMMVFAMASVGAFTFIILTCAIIGWVDLCRIQTLLP